MTFHLFVLRINKLLQILTSWTLFKAFFIYGVLAGSEHRNILSSGFNTIVDIGANKGQFTLASRVWSPKSQIISFEPLPLPRIIFNKLFDFDKNVSLFPFAIGPNKGSFEINLSAHIDSSSLLPIGPNQIDIFPGTEKVGALLIDVSPLDEFLEPNDLVSPALLKLDVQGFELQALKGCSKLLQYFDAVYCECSFIELYTGQHLVDEIINWLDSYGFKLIGVYNCSYSILGQAIQADFLFRKIKD